MPAFFSFSLFAFEQTSLVVQPWSDGSYDLASQQVSKSLRDLLQPSPLLDLVEGEKVSAVTAYHPAERNSSANLEESKQLLAEAKELYFQLGLSEAEGKLLRITDLFAQNPELKFSEGQILLDAWVVLGLVHTARHKQDLAQQDFANACRLNPFFQLDEKTYPPSIRRLFEKAKGELAKEKSGNIQIEGEPKVADVYLNGIYQGVSPLTLKSLPVGEYTLHFHASHYRSVDQQIAVHEGETVSIRHHLYWNPRPVEASAVLPSPRGEMEEGLRVADLLKVDKVLLVNVEAKQVEARLLDRRFRAAHQPLVVAPIKNGMVEPADLDTLARLIFAQIGINLLDDPQAHLDPDGIGDPILLAASGRSKISKPFLWGGIGAVGVSGIVAGVLAATSGSETGSVSLNFK